MTKIRIPAALRAYAGGQSVLSVSGRTVGAALDDLFRQYPALQAHLCDVDAELRPFVNLFLGQHNVRDLQGKATPLSGEEQLILIPSIAGGTAPPPANGGRTRLDD
jgi:molybdopterin converting factor small subunit